jgi:hypothetical protein
MEGRLAENPGIIEAAVTVQGADGAHFLGGEFEVEQRQILN